MASTSEIKYNAIDILSGRPISRWLRQWWYRRAEEHYLICAAVEHSRAREAEENEA